MRREKRVIFAILVIACTFLQASMVPLTTPNVELKALHHARLLGLLEAKKITLTLWLKLRNKEKLDRLVSKLYNPKSKFYQQFLTNEQFESQYGSSLNAKKVVQQFFKEQGIKTKLVFTNINVTASVQQIEQLFHLKMNRYQHHNGIVYGNDQAPTIPAEIEPYVSAVSGLSDIIYAQSKNGHHPAKKSIPIKNKVTELNLAWPLFKPAYNPTTLSLQGISGSQLRTAYNLSNIPAVNGVTIDGAGQTIVIIDGCGSDTKDEIKKYSNRYNRANHLPLLNDSNFAVVKHDGSDYDNQCSNPSGWTEEILLDIQASHTIAPGANIVLALTDQIQNDQVAEIMNTILNHHFSIGGFNNAYVVSNSWDNFYENQVEPLDTIYESAAAQGMSVNFAAGDCGDQTYNSSWTCSILSATPSIQYPVSSTYVTAVSGTSLFVDNYWNYAFETGWGTLVNGSFYSGSMGGISQYRDFPIWQSNISGFVAGGYNQGSVGQYNKRAIPDIAMLGDLYTGLLVYSQSCSACYEGGASLATPLFSGTIALVNQARALTVGAQNPIGLIAPYLYTNNTSLIQARALNLITPAHEIISGASPVAGGPVSAFKLYNTYWDQEVTFNWDSSLTLDEDQFWNDVVGVGSPNIPNFVQTFATI